MTRNTANVSFYCRESKKNKDGTAPIEMSLVINGKRCYVQLPRKEVPADLEVVAKLLGHSTTRITQHYAKLLKDNILNEVKDAFEKSY